MFFTQEDYRKIEKWLLANSIKDTDFVGAATPLKGNETLAFVQDGKNVNVRLKDLIEQIFLLGVSDFLNVSDKYGESIISLTQAIQLIPFRSRKEGQVITFLDEEGHWKLYQFQGKSLNQWNNSTLWIDLLAKISGIPIIDSEDIITKVDDAKQVSLYLADKQYNEADYSGLGRIYLRKNIQNIIDPLTGAVINVNLLTQSMLAKENTTYIIQYDYNLNNQTISIPEGSVLLFEGGSINDGTINCNGTTIVGKFSENTTIVGTYSFQDAQADEEDITQNQSSVLKFKDRKYEPDKYSGLGRVILRKNIVEINDPVYGKVTKNILFQDMITQSNTIYEIRYDFDLNDSTINIPDNCVLSFVGGQLKNGTISGRCTIDNKDNNFIFNNIIIKDILNDKVYIEWFGGIAYSYWEDVQNGVSSTNALKLAIQSNGSRTILFNNGYYKIDKTISLPSYITIEGNAINSKYYNIRRKATPTVPLSSKIYFNSTDDVLFEINNNHTAIKNISLHGTRDKDAIHLIDSGYTVKLENVQIYIWKYGIYRTWNKTSRTGFSGSKITNCAFAELTGGIFIDYDEADAGSELYFITANEIENTIFTVIKAFAVYYKSNYSISNNVFRMNTFSKIGYGNYELDLYNIFGCFAIKIESFQTSTINGGNKIDSCYFEDIIPYRTGTIEEGETVLNNGSIIPTDGSNYSTCIFYNCNIELDTTYYSNILRFFKIDNNTSIGINNTRFYSFIDVFNNNVWKYTRLIYHVHSALTPKYLNSVIAYNNNWRIATTSVLTGLVSYAVYNDRLTTTVINQIEDKFADYPPYIIENSSNILSTRQVSGNLVKFDCVCTTSSLESTYIEGQIVYKDLYCKFITVVDNVNGSVKCNVTEDGGFQAYGITVRYKKITDTSFSLYFYKEGVKFTFIPVRTSIVSSFKLSAAIEADIPADAINGTVILKVNGYSNLPVLGNSFKGTQVYEPNLEIPLFYNGADWYSSDGTLPIKVIPAISVNSFNRANVTYRIVRDIDLAGETLTIRANCTLDFQGGSISNGTVTFNNTKVIQQDIENYITATIEGNYKEGQIIYDNTLKKMKLWNGIAWVNLDGTALT